MHAPISAIIPAHNEAATIAKVVTTMRAMAPVAEVVVIDNGSEDGTAEAARMAGATVVSEARRGMGHAVRCGVAAARHDWVMKVDADLGRFDTALFARMAEARAPGVGLVKGAWNDPHDNMPMTRLLVRPALRLMFPGLGGLNAPNTGIYLFDRSMIAHEQLTGDYAVDLDVMLRVYAAGAGVAEVDIGRIVHDARDVGHYNAMAEQILAFFLSRQPLGLLEEVVVMAETETDVARHAGGVIAGKLISGARVSVYLAEGGGVLDAVFAVYPTYRRAPLAKAARHVPHANAARQRVIASHAIRPEAMRAPVPVDIWEMPGAAGFAADVSVGTGAGGALKRAALDRLGLSGAVSPREVFRVVAEG
ncbi:glycosyltransferase [Roseovarius autotrophicus]|uniref:glycosyltransferase n=1 Tax=Roseovarius autotrophicus TaxID=2824121 RepID=UPI001B35A53B|nr:glycosyltransferase [Roseovarius autotrophicus]